MTKLTTMGFITIITTSMLLNYPAYATEATTGTPTTAVTPNVVSNPPQNNAPATPVPAPTTVAPQSGTTNLPKKDTNRKPPVNKKENETWTNKLKDKWKEREKEHEHKKEKERSVQDKTDKHEKSTK